MSKITWDGVGERVWEAGVDHGVLYRQDDQKKYTKGYAWNGLINVTEKPEGAEITKLWADNQNYANLMSAEVFKGNIEAYTYPDEFNECEGHKEIVPGARIGQQARVPFGLCYRSMVGDDTSPEPSAYKLHLIWGAMVSPTEKAHNTINENPDAETFNWDFDTTPVPVTGFKPSASMEIDSRTLAKDKMAAIEEILYGAENTEPRLPMPDELIDIMKATAAAANTGEEQTGE